MIDLVFIPPLLRHQDSTARCRYNVESGAWRPPAASPSTLSESFLRPER